MKRFFFASRQSLGGSKFNLTWKSKKKDDSPLSPGDFDCPMSSRDSRPFSNWWEERQRSESPSSSEDEEPSGAQTQRGQRGESSLFSKVNKPLGAQTECGRRGFSRENKEPFKERGRRAFTPSSSEDEETSCSSSEDEEPTGAIKEWGHRDEEPSGAMKERGRRGESPSSSKTKEPSKEHEDEETSCSSSEDEEPTGAINKWGRPSSSRNKEPSSSSSEDEESSSSSSEDEEPTGTINKWGRRDKEPFHAMKERRRRGESPSSSEDEEPSGAQTEQIQEKQKIRMELCAVFKERAKQRRNQEPEQDQEKIRQKQEGNENQESEESESEQVEETPEEDWFERNRERLEKQIKMWQHEQRLRRESLERRRVERQEKELRERKEREREKLQKEEEKRIKRQEMERKEAERKKKREENLDWYARVKIRLIDFHREGIVRKIEETYRREKYLKHGVTGDSVRKAELKLQLLGCERRNLIRTKDSLDRQEQRYIQIGARNEKIRQENMKRRAEKRPKQGQTLCSCLRNMFKSHNRVYVR